MSRWPERAVDGAFRGAALTPDFEFAARFAGRLLETGAEAVEGLRGTDAAGLFDWLDFIKGPKSYRTLRRAQ
jgi:hypothetical protein